MKGRCLNAVRALQVPARPAQGEQRRSSYFNIPRGNSSVFCQRPHADFCAALARFLDKGLSSRARWREPCRFAFDARRRCVRRGCAG